ncbi:citryl-CoA lyase [Propionivibrio dicarboxylicus]|uniref:citrate synthase (unknown stereospecificity) n=1 Tax=Propionivibrio dicarboxylicus TaxID=83767 RepID=A0A1G8NYZ2_9RHOO|nr:citryl-CoA lyase [Propionivibrio dicarboxylicus]SDI85482.1 citrate synthase [Propionivibrio dicarboxylicus]
MAMSEQLAREKLDSVSQWWSTEIIDVHPGEIAVRGYRIGDLIGQVNFIDMIWLMLRGNLPRPAEAALLEAALVASVDHGPQAPAISIARMATTCGLPVNGAMASAINALGEYHGGSGQLCMELFAQINAEAGLHGDLVDAAITVIQDRLMAGNQAIPGFGHRFHPVDPRVAPLLDLVGNAVAAGTISGRYAAIARATETALGVIKQRYIAINVEGMTSAIYCELGFSPELGRGLFVLSRSVGILAHAWEQKQQGERGKGPMPKDIPYTYSGPRYRPVPENRAARRAADAL